MERPALPAGRPDNERVDAARWLEEFLALGPVPSKEVRKAAEAQGFSYGTLRKAFRGLSGKATRMEGKKDWQWALAGRKVVHRANGCHC